MYHLSWFFLRWKFMFFNLDLHLLIKFLEIFSEIITISRSPILFRSVFSVKEPTTLTEIHSSIL